MLLTLLLASASQCFAQLPLSQFKPLSDSTYLAVPEYQTGNKYQKDAILFMDMVADTHPYYIKPHGELQSKDCTSEEELGGRRTQGRTVPVAHTEDASRLPAAETLRR